MAQTPSPGLPKPKYSAIPTPGRIGLPTPTVRSRSMTSGGSAASSPLDETFSKQFVTTSPSIAPTRVMKRPSLVSTTAASSEQLSTKPPVTGSNRGITGSTSYTKRASFGRPPSAASAASSSSRQESDIRSRPRASSPGYSSTASSRAAAPRSSFPSRPQSRVSDAQVRSASRTTQRSPEVGDLVRIESINMEGTLRYLGDIAGKPGHWAGVELSGGFAGRGKNDGSVAGVQYFSCPPKCGVFVASNKLALQTPTPTVVVRPDSVTSSRGRATPSVAPQRQRVLSSAEASVIAQSKITAGSRASKYIGVTAKELSIRAPISPQKKTPVSRGGSPPRVTTTPKAPRHSFGIPSSAPKPRTSVPSFATPRPSKVQLSTSKSKDMPPPATLPSRPGLATPDRQPVTPTFSQAGSDSNYGEDAFSDGYINGNNSPLMTRRRSAIFTPSTPEPNLELQRLQNLVQTLELQNRELIETIQTSKTQEEQSKATVEVEKQTTQQKISQLESQLRASERSCAERQTKVESLDRQIIESKEDIKRSRAEGETRAKDLQAKVEESEGLVNSLKSLIEAKASAATENSAIIEARRAEIDVLQTKVARLSAELETERRELGEQVEDLRKAGQETIALYEERISTFEAERYEMEGTIQVLEEKLREAALQPSPGELVKQASTAMQIDNETLKEQAVHLQQRIQHLEDQLEESRATAEREEAAIHARITRYKEKDSQLKMEVEETRRHAVASAKSEAAARGRIEELEEALRENSLALEDARAEIECLRTDLTNLESSQEKADGGEKDRKVAPQKSVEEINHLKDSLESAKRDRQAMSEQLAAAKGEAEASARMVQTLRVTVDTLEAEKAEIRRLSVDSSKRTRDSLGSSTSRTKDDNLRDQVSGLKHMMQELQKENSSYTAKIRSLESENRLLMSETDDLKEAVRALEIAVDESIQREEESLAQEEAFDPATADPASLQRQLRETRIRYESEVDQLRRRLTDAEKKSSKTIAELNKEVNDLESLVEAKIYREDDLEREVERLKEKVQRLQSKGSKTNGDSRLAERADKPPPAVVEDTYVEGNCEICEQPGHDIFSCPVLKGDDTGPSYNGSTDLYCEDCEAHDHSTADCPHSLDVF